MDCTIIEKVQQDLEHGFISKGSGYSALRYLTSMPVDIIRFDISLIQGMMDDRLCKLVQEMASMLIGLGYDLVAEGIESEELLVIVDSAGFNLSQGYLFVRQPEVVVSSCRQRLYRCQPLMTRLAINI